MKTFWKRSLALLLTLVLTVGAIPTGIFPLLTVSAAEEDGWYWEDSVLYIKDGSITGANFIAAVQEKTGDDDHSSVAYSTSDFKVATVWHNSGTKITNGTTYTNFNHSSTYYAATLWTEEKSGFWGSYTDYQASQTGSFTVKHYYNPTVTVTDNDGSGVTATVTEKVIKGETATVTVSAAGEDGWTATVGGEAKNLSATEATTFTVTVDSVDAANIAVTVQKATPRNVNVVVNSDTPWGTASADVTSGIDGTSVTITATPNDSTNAYSYYLVDIKVNGTAISGNTFTIDGTDANVVVTFGRNGIQFGEDKNTNIEFNGWYQDATQLSDVQLNALKQELFAKLDVESLPEGATWDNVTIQYFPLKVGKVSGNSEYDSNCYDLTHATIDGTIYEYRNFGERAYNNGAALKEGINEKVRITYNGFWIEQEITLVEARPELDAGSGTYGSTVKIDAITNESDLNSVYAAALSVLANAPTGGTPSYTYVVDGTLNSDNPVNVKVNITYAETADYVDNTPATVIVPVQLNEQPSKIVVEENTAGAGDFEIKDANGMTVTESASEGTLTITVTPVGNNSGYYVESVVVKDKDGNDVTVSYSYSSAVYTGSFEIANDNEYTLTVNYGQRIINVNGDKIVKANGYVVDDILDDYSARMDDLKKKILLAVFGEDVTIADYNVYIWLDADILGSDHSWVNMDDSGFDSIYANQINIDGTELVKIEWKASSDGVQPTVYLENIEIAIQESRVVPTINVGSLKEDYNDLAAFKQAVWNALTVNGSADKASFGLTEDDVILTPVDTFPGTFTVSVKFNEGGATWRDGTAVHKDAFDNPIEITVKVSVYTVVFYDSDGTTVLDSVDVEYGDTPVYGGKSSAELAKEKNNAQYTYTFAGWTPEIQKVTDANGDGTIDVLTYTATYTTSVNKYTITFVDHDGKELQSSEVEYGTVPTAPADPTRASTTTIVYTFTGWDKAVIAVTGAATYTATYTKATRYYTVTFVNADGTVLQTVEGLSYNEVPEYTAGTPTKAADNTYTYTFKGWDKTVVGVTDDGVVYKATYTSYYIDYNIKWDVNGIVTTDTLHYGDPIVVPADPDNWTDSEKNYYFAGWDVDGDGKFTVGETVPATVTGDATFTAVFSNKTLWNVKVVYDNGTADATGKVEEGNTYTIPAAPTRPGYCFMGWDVNGETNAAGAVITIAADTTITAQWAELFTVTWMNDGKVYLTETDKYAAGETPTAPADPTKAADAQYTYTFAGWTPSVGAITGDITYTAVYTNTVNSYVITFTDENGNVLDQQTLNYGATPVYAGNTPVKTYYSWTWDKTVAAVTGNATYKLVWTPNTDANTNGVADETETITVMITGKGTGTVTINGTVVKHGDSYLYDSTKDSNVVVATPDISNAANGSASYCSTITVDGVNGVQSYENHVASATIAFNGVNTLNVQFVKLELNTTNNATVKINKYYTAGSDKAALATLRTDILKAAGLDPNGNYVVTAIVGIQSLGDWATWTVEINDGNATVVKGTELLYNQGYLANELNKASYSFTITMPGNGSAIVDVSKSVTMQMTDSRPSAGLNDKVFSEVKVFDGSEGLNDYVDSLLLDKELNPNGLTVTRTDTVGWPPETAGVTVTLVYTVTYEDSADYIGDTCTLTVNVQSAYNNCTVTGDDKLTAGGSLKVSPSNDNKTVAGNDKVTVTVTPADGKFVTSITVTNTTTNKVVEISAISYSDRTASVTFTSDGSMDSDAYVVSAEYSDTYLSFNQNATITYCIDNDKVKADLKKLVFDAIYNSACVDLREVYDDVTVEYVYAGALGINLWADVTKDPSVSINGITHKFGEDGSETIRVTYEDEKYGTLQATVELYIFDSCYNNTIDVTTKAPDGIKHNFSVEYSEDERAYQGTDYYKQDTVITVTLTPNGDILDILEQTYNGTYSDSMAYIKSVTVYDKNGKIVESVLVREKSTLSLEGILSGVTPNLYNAAVTFTMSSNEEYEIVAEYGVLDLNVKSGDITLEMYQGGENYPAKVPSAEEIFYAIIGECSDDFLEVYGDAYKVEFSTDLVSYSWKEVTDENLLALNDGTKIAVRITWNGDTTNTYYPVAEVKDITLVDFRTPTSIVGSVPEEKIEYVDEDQLIANLKDAMGLGVAANGSAIDSDYTVTYNITGNDTDGYFATVYVYYDGTASYKPSEKTFENVPVADIPDNATIKVTISNAADVVTNNAGKLQTVINGIYTVLGNGTYTFKFTPATGYAVESVTVNGEAIDLVYNKRVVTFSMEIIEKEHYEIVVTTVESKFVTEEDRIYDFATGWDTPVNEDIVDAAISTPSKDKIDYSKIKIEYLARESGTATITIPEIVISDMLGLSIPASTFDIELGELWLDPNAPIEEVDLGDITEYLVAELFEKVSSGELGINEVYSYVENYLKGLTIGAHVFGSAGDGSVETIRISYEDEKYLIPTTITDVTIHDYRTVTEIKANDCEVTFGYSLEQLIAAASAGVYANGVKVNGLVISTDDLYFHADEAAQQITLYFAGNAEYQPCELTINVTVNKAQASIDYDSQFITYGDEYDFALHVSPVVMPDGSLANIQILEFMIALDMHTMLDVDIEDKTVGLDKMITYIQIRLPDEIRNSIIGKYLQGEMSLSAFIDLVNSLNDMFGLDESSMEILDQIMQAITGITDNLDITVKLSADDFKPENVGVYVAGAVTIDSDFETAYTADYLIIAPKTVEVEMDWDYTDDNMIMTLPAYKETFKDLMGAHVVENDIITGDVLNTANGHVKYLILAINDETSEFLTTDIYGNIKANIYTDPDAITDNGAYIQIAYMLNWGNEIYYAMPIVRSFVIVPQTVDVQLQDKNGNDNNDLLLEFNNNPHSFNATVTNMAGEEIVNLYKGMNSEWLEIRYIGLQTNTRSYNSTEPPVHAGAYLVIATYIEYDESRNLLCAGMDTGILVITPTDSSIKVDDFVILEYDDTNVDIKDVLNFEVTSKVPGLVPDITVITAMIAANGDFSENGWQAVDGIVNIDFPSWMDELIAQYLPDVSNGITVGELKDKLLNKLPEIIASEDLSDEVINSLNNLISNIAEILEKMPEDIEITFDATDNLSVKSVGAHLVAGIVTDSDHYPSMDMGMIVIVPDVTFVELDWNYKDANGIFTPELLQFIDLYASAFDKETGEKNDAATEKITHRFFSIDTEGNLLCEIDASKLTNGIYLEVAYIEFELAGKMTISDMIARIIVILPNTVDVEITGKDSDDRIYREFDNEDQDVSVDITYDGTVIVPNHENLTVTYVGVLSDGSVYNSSAAPVHVGVYFVIAIYVERDDNGNIIAVGADTANLIIVPTESDITVDNGMVEWDGEDHKVADLVKPSSKVEGLSPDTTVISVGISANLEEINGLNSINGTINVDLPSWIDEAFAELGVLEAAYSNGITVATFIGYVDKLKTAFAEMELDTATLDKLAEIVESFPINAKLTFFDDAAYSEVGAYLVIGIVTDTDHYPSVDMGLMVIYPNANEVELRFEDDLNGNNIFTWTALKNIDLDAKAYNIGASAVNTVASALVTNVYFGFTDDGKIIITTDKNELDNGVYTQVAYLLDFGNEFYYAKPISRVFTIVPTPANVEFVDDNGNANDGRHFVFNNKPHAMNVKVTVNGVLVTDLTGLTVTYVGVQTNGEVYNSTVAPTNAGSYIVTAVYTEKDSQGRLVTLGVATGAMIIEPASSSVDVDNVIHEYDGNKVNIKDMVHSSSSASEVIPDVTVITAAIKTNGTFSENLFGAIERNVNVDLPAWADKILVEYGIVQDGISIKTFVDAIEKLGNNIIQLGTEAGVDVDVEYFDALISILENIPDNSTLTFNDDPAYREVGAYFVIGIVTDSNHSPSADAGIMIIYPDVDKAELNWIYRDTNNIFTLDTLSVIDLGAYATVDGTLSNDVPFKVLYFGFNSETFEIVLTDDQSELDLGVYTEIAYVLDVDSQMYVAKPIIRTVMIVANVYDVQAEDSTHVYDGEAKDVGDIAVIDQFGNNIINNGGELTVTYMGVTGAINGYMSTTAPTDAGIYSVIIKFITYDEDGNVSGVGSKVVRLTIEKAEPDFDLTDTEEIYDTEEKFVDIINDQELEYIAVIRTEDGVNLIFTEGLSVLADYLGDDVYDLSGFKTAIEKAIAKVEGFDIDSEFIDSLISVIEEVNDRLVYQITVNGANPVEVGTYKAYAISIPTANYNTDVSKGTLVIKPMDIKVKLDSFTVQAGDEMPAFTYVVTDSEGNILDITLDIELFCEVSDASNVGTYAITSTLGENKNYNVLEVENGTLTVLPNEITSVEVSGEYVYISEEQTADVTVKFEETILTEGVDYTVEGHKYTNAGTYTVTVTGIGNYTGVLTAEWTISPAEITITVADNSKYYGDTDPEAEAVVTVNKGSVELDVTVDRISGNNVGEYHYGVVYVKSNNYVVTEELGALTINPAEITITVADNSKYYGETDPEAEAVVTVNKGSVELDVTVDRISGNNVGKYPYRVVYVKSDNYIVTETLGMLTITPAEITVTVADNSKYYGDTDPEAEAEVEVTKGVVDLAVTVKCAEGEDVGTYDYYVVYTESDNYVVTEELGALTINPAEITITVADNSKYYGEDDPEAEAVVTVNKGSVELEVTVKRAEGEDVDTYNYYLVYTESDNYVVTEELGALTINPAEITVSVADNSKYYGETDPEAEAVVTVNKGSVELDVTVNRVEGEDASKYGYKVEYTKSFNYKVTEELGALTINPAEISVKIQSAEKYYGDSDPEVKAEITVINGKIDLDVSADRADGEDVKSYAYIAEIEKSFNYKIVEEDIGSLTIKPAKVKITVADASKCVGTAENPEFTYELSCENGTVTKETLGVVLACDNGTAIGTYSINATYNESDNYDVEVVSGELTIQDHTNSYTYVDNKNGTHSATYDCCGTAYVTNETHNHGENGICVCGAEKAEMTLRGDLDLDGDVDIEDLTLLARHVAVIEPLDNATAIANADVNGDGQVDIEDLTLHARYVARIISDWEDQ